MGKIAAFLVVMSWVVAVPMCSVMCEISLQGMVDKAKEVGISQETIENAATIEEAQKVLKDGTAQQALNDAKDAATGSSWGDWVKDTVGNMGFGKESGAPPPEEAGIPLTEDIELSPSRAPEQAPANAPTEESSPSLSPSLLSPLPPPSPSPSPTIEAPAPVPVAEEAPTDAPASAPS